MLRGLRSRFILKSTTTVAFNTGNGGMVTIAP